MKSCCQTRTGHWILIDPMLWSVSPRIKASLINVFAASTWSCVIVGGEFDEMGKIEFRMAVSVLGKSFLINFWRLSGRFGIVMLNFFRWSFRCELNNFMDVRRSSCRLEGDGVGIFLEQRDRTCDRGPVTSRPRQDTCPSWVGMDVWKGVHVQCGGEFIANDLAKER